VALPVDSFLRVTRLVVEVVDLGLLRLVGLTSGSRERLGTGRLVDGVLDGGCGALDGSSGLGGEVGGLTTDGRGGVLNRLSGALDLARRLRGRGKRVRSMLFGVDDLLRERRGLGEVVNFRVLRVLSRRLLLRRPSRPKNRRGVVRPVGRSGLERVSTTRDAVLVGGRSGSLLSVRGGRGGGVGRLLVLLEALGVGLSTLLSVAGEGSTTVGAGGGLARRRSDGSLSGEGETEGSREEAGGTVGEYVLALLHSSTS
jgi:hypothetical protein